MAFAKLQLISTLLVVATVVALPILASSAGGARADAVLLPVALGYTAIQMLCAAAVLLAPWVRQGVGQGTQ